MPKAIFLFFFLFLSLYIMLGQWDLSYSLSIGTFNFHSWLVWPEIKCMVHVALPKRLINQFKPVQQSRQQALSYELTVLISILFFLYSRIQSRLTKCRISSSIRRSSNWISWGSKPLIENRSFSCKKSPIYLYMTIDYLMPKILYDTQWV